MNRNYGFGGSKVTNKGSMNWRGTRKKIDGGSIPFMTSRRDLSVIPFPHSRVTQQWDRVEWGDREYRVRPGSLVHHLRYLILLVDQ